MRHKFKIQQLVRLTGREFAKLRAGAGGTYEVIRLMPADETGELSYRIKSDGAGERAVRESEITAGYAEIGSLQ